MVTVHHLAGRPYNRINSVNTTVLHCDFVFSIHAYSVDIKDFFGSLPGKRRCKVNTNMNSACSQSRTGTYTGYSCPAMGTTWRYHMFVFCVRGYIRAGRGFFPPHK